MDHFEQMAFDLEMAQQARFKLCADMYNFFDDNCEDKIFLQIKHFRSRSETFNPDNPR